MTRRVRDFGWKPSLPGVLATPADTTGLTVLDRVDPRSELPPVFDQLKLGSCTANATGAAFEYDAHLDGHQTGRLSRLWIYWYERFLEGTLSQGDCGAMGSDAFIAAARWGVPPESAWHYGTSSRSFNPKTPPAKAVAAAASSGAYRLTKPTHLLTRNELDHKRALSNKQTIAFGFTVYQSFEDEASWQDGKMPEPQPGEQPIGGHEILEVGYLPEEPDYMLCRNSWGGGWMLGGYFLFPKRLLFKTRMCSDMRTIVRSIAA